MTQPNYGHYEQPRDPQGRYAGFPEVAPPKKSRKGLWVTLGVVGAGLAACLIGCTALLASSADTKTPGDKTINTTAPAVAAPASKATSKPAPLPTKGAALPKPADFKLTVKILEKSCFGSAGCNVQYRISKVDYSGPTLDADASYEISFKITGLEDPKIGTFTLNGDGTYSVEERELGQTSSSGKVLKAVVTAVEAV